MNVGRLSPEVAIRKADRLSVTACCEAPRARLAFEVRKRVDPDSEHTRRQRPLQPRDRLADSPPEMSMASIATADRLTDAPHGSPSCGAVHAVGAHRLCLGSGPVPRCPACDAVALCVATLPGRHIVHLSGAWRLETPHIDEELLG
jgi:hypothetical protein